MKESRTTRCGRRTFAGSARGSRPAFTLIELLVVIAIIALLVSILLPSLQRAKDLAKGVVCMSNMKNVSTALFTYATDFNDAAALYVVWPDASGTPVTLYWHMFLTGTSRGLYTLSTMYMEKNDSFVCPTEAPEHFLGSSGAYGYHRDMKDMPILPTPRPAGVTADPVFVRVSEIPSDQILFGDTTFLTGGKWQQWAWFKSRSAAATETLLHTRHNETVNGLFHDGHVEASSPGELGKTGVLYYRDHQYVNQVTPTP